MAIAAAAGELGVFDEVMQYSRIKPAEVTNAVLLHTTRMSRQLFNELTEELRPHLERQTNRHQAIPVDTQLFVALGFYASGGFQWLSGTKRSLLLTLHYNLSFSTDQLLL